MSELDIALELAKLHSIRGVEFVRQLKMLTNLSIFKPVENEKIFSPQKQAIVTIGHSFLMGPEKPSLMVTKFISYPTPKEPKPPTISLRTRVSINCLI